MTKVTPSIFSMDSDPISHFFGRFVLRILIGTDSPSTEDPTCYIASTELKVLYKGKYLLNILQTGRDRDL